MPRSDRKTSTTSSYVLPWKLEAVVIVCRVGGNVAEQREQKTQRRGKAGSPFSCDHGNLRNER